MKYMISPHLAQARKLTVNSGLILAERRYRGREVPGTLALG